MVTPELASYVKSQLAAGQTPQSISSILSAQGWSPQDIQSALGSSVLPQTPVNPAYTPNPVAYNQAVPKGTWTIGRVVLWVFIVGFIGAALAAAAFGYYAYSNIANLPKTICSDSKDSANCQQMVRNFFGFLMKNAANGTNNNSGSNNPISNLVSNQSQSGCTGYQNSSGMTGFADFVGVSDPLLCYYSQSADISGFSSVTMNISGTKNNGTASKIVSDIKNQKMTIYGKDGKSFTMESAATSSLLSSQFAGGYIDWFKIEIPFLNFCAKSTGWNTNGNWFTCDKVTMMGVTISSNDPNQSQDNGVSEIKLGEIDTPSGKALDLETRSIKDSQFSAAHIIVFREGRLLQSSKSIDISNYSGTDLMNGLSVDQIVAKYPNSQYSDAELTYQK